MRNAKIWGWICLVTLASAIGWAQDARRATDFKGDGGAIPRLVRFAGIANDESGKPMHGVVGITFALYREQEGGAPLWLETQNVELDGKAHYAVLLGASKPDGLPSDLFSSGEARWLGVQPERQPEQPRVLLVSVPYALKAGDAETVGGKPPSAFVLAPPADAVQRPAQGGLPTNSVGGTGTTNFIPIWKSSTTLGNSAIFQSSGRVGISTTTPHAKLESVVGSEGTLALRLDSGPNSFLDITPTNAGGRFQTEVSTVNNRDLIFLPGTGNVGIGQTGPTAKLELVGPGEGSRALRLDSGPNAFLDVVPTNPSPGVFQTVLDTVNGRDIVLLPRSGRLGIGTTSPANMLEVVTGGTTLADAWTVRSSRRFKTNIKPLEGALEKVEKLQGVAYDRKSDGRHEIGVIAEDVDQVIPEVVSRDPRTKEVQGVDYARLAALLIEAVKTQQAEIQQLNTQIGQLTSQSAYGQ